MEGWEMPRTLTLNPDVLNNLFTSERLNSYTAVFAPRDEFELVGAYLWNSRVCGALHPILGAAEITLRNSIDGAVSSGPLGRFWWSSSKLQWKSRGQGLIPYPVAKLRENFSKASSQVIREKKERYQIRGHIKPTHHEIISKTDFSTWEFALDGEFMGRGLLWNLYLSSVFSGDWGGRRPSVLLTHARNLVNAVRHFRNRVSHHEPVWKGAGIANPEDATRHLARKLLQVVQLIELIEPVQVQILRKNGLLGEAERACSASELRRYQLMTRERTITSRRGLALVMKQCESSNASFYVRRSVSSSCFLLTPVT
ncbi:hypothetical protein Q0S19_06005 [Stenotrophomonas indicatrix]|uniref:hypothetical protein n=1 Tax=Stenotrophomonas indicatrix TaxID=2045451 RepID=UPI002650803D|nr:hypothetical protein [Stenotrophomonas indicatrix]MDN8644023.1 hypothetical protein [Stenotrophomonas indicatrix]MDN8654317.1 hypothetical protein [Stenotrophomonas indicatrix]